MKQKAQFELRSGTANIRAHIKQALQCLATHAVVENGGSLLRKHPGCRLELIDLPWRLVLVF
jgi:hypothetical protein